MLLPKPLNTIVVMARLRAEQMLYGRVKWALEGPFGVCWIHICALGAVRRTHSHCSLRFAIYGLEILK